jgi:PAT family beta-lactamase induction signal transducer AmpG
MRRPRPWHVFFLIFPYGASFGFVAVALTYLAKERGVDVEAIGRIIALSFVPHAYKFLWAPIVDATFSRRAWYVASSLLVAAGTFVSAAAPLGPSTIGDLTVIVVVAQIGLTLLGMACEGMIGHDMLAESKPAAAAWLQAGIFVGSGIGGSAGIELVDHLGGRTGGAILGAAFLACGFPVFLFDAPRTGERAELRPLAGLRSLGRDLWALVRSRRGLVALLLCVSPIGSGAAGNLFGAIAGEWRASREVVALATGAAGSLASAAGAAIALWAVRRARGPIVYLAAGALTATAGAAMAAAPHEPMTYIVFTLAYQLFNGLAFAAFSAFAFDAAGHGAVVTKYNIMASLANLSIVYATRIDSLAHVRWGGAGVLFTDTALTTVAIALFGAASLVLRGWQRRSP